jgi:hypothetical protein
MKYTIISEKVGIVGTEFVPGAGTNIEALLAHGFIESDEIANDSTAPKSAKTKAPAKKD